MTHTTTTSAPTTTARARAGELITPVAAGSTVLALALTAFGIWGDGSGGGEDAIPELLVISGVVVVAAATLFGWLVPRSLRSRSTGAVALTLSVLAFLLVAVFWSGLPPVLASAGILLGIGGREDEKGRGLASAAIAVGILALFADLGIYAFDWLSTNEAL